MYFRSDTSRSMGMTDATTWIAVRDTVWYALAIFSTACRCTDNQFLVIMKLHKLYIKYMRVFPGNIKHPIKWNQTCKAYQLFFKVQLHIYVVAS